MNAMEFALTEINKKTIKTSTKREYLSICKNLGLENLEMPLNPQEITQILAGIYNDNSRRKCAIALRSIYGLKIRITSASPAELNLPGFEVLHEIIQSSRHYAMYGNLMLHCGMRIGETVVKQPIKGSLIIVNRQRNGYNEVTSSKSSGPVVAPPWLLERYQDWEPKHHYNTVYLGITRLFRKHGHANMTCHKLRHAYASHYSQVLSPEALRKQMRHRNVQTTMSYYVHVSENDIQKNLFKI